MATYKEIVYMILDELKINSDDSYIEEEHVLFLMDKYRALLLKQRYSDIRKFISEANYQTICLSLTEVPAISGEPCEGGSYLRSTLKIPFLLDIGIPRVYPIDYYQGEISYISRDRMRYVGYNKYLQNMIYCSLGPDTYLYFKSNNPQFLYLEKVRMIGVFSDTKKAFNLQCAENNTVICDILDSNFPLQDDIIPTLVQLTVKELLGTTYRPEDSSNNNVDDASNIVNTIAKNTNLEKQIEG